MRSLRSARRTGHGFGVRFSGRGALVAEGYGGDEAAEEAGESGPGEPVGARGVGLDYAVEKQEFEDQAGEQFIGDAEAAQQQRHDGDGKGAGRAKNGNVNFNTFVHEGPRRDTVDCNGNCNTFIREGARRFAKNGNVNTFFDPRRGAEDAGGESVRGDACRHAGVGVRAGYGARGTR